jgi:hypothetical protein
MNILKQTAALLMLIVILLSLSLAPSVLGHAPLGTGDNEKISTATVIPDPTKSWALYSALNSDGDPQYYTFNVTPGQRIHVMLLKSMSSTEKMFLPMFVILGPQIQKQGTPIEKVTIPPEDSWQVISSQHPAATYEPFSPSSFYALSETAFNAPASGQYYVVVYENSTSPTGGHYGLAIGDRESYTLDEWVLLPLNLLSIYQWEGQSLVGIIAPMIAIVIIGMILVAWRLRIKCQIGNPFSWVGALAGLVLIGSGADTLLQMIIALFATKVAAEALVTLIFAILPIALGLLALRLSLLNQGKIGIRGRAYLVIIGVASLFLWAGIFIGPILAVTTAIMPTKIGKAETIRRIV